MAQHEAGWGRVVAPGILVSALWLTGCGGGDGPPQAGQEMPQQVIVSGQGVPAASVGEDGQFYLDAQGLALYGPKVSGRWPQPPVALRGADGRDGADGVSGSRILSGPGAPGDALGSDGDFYLDTASARLHGPKSAGGWPAPALALTGPAGPAGANGIDGIDGAPGPRGAPGAQGVQGPAGASQFDITWGIFPNTTFGDGTYYLLPQGLSPLLRNPVLLPQPCTQAQLQVATLGVPAVAATYTFTVLRTPGPALLPASTASTAMVCSLDAAARACTVGQAVTYAAGDAIEVQVVGNSAIDQMATPGSWAVGFSCR